MVDSNLYSRLNENAMLEGAALLEKRSEGKIANVPEDVQEKLN